MLQPKPMKCSRSEEWKNTKRGHCYTAEDKKLQETLFFALEPTETTTYPQMWKSLNFKESLNNKKIVQPTISGCRVHYAAVSS